MHSKFDMILRLANGKHPIQDVAVAAAEVGIREALLEKPDGAWCRPTGANKVTKSFATPVVARYLLSFYL